MEQEKNVIKIRSRGNRFFIAFKLRFTWCNAVPGLRSAPPGMTLTFSNIAYDGNIECRPGLDPGSDGVTLEFNNEPKVIKNGIVLTYFSRPSHNTDRN